jgi:hypothetical protein
MCKSTVNLPLISSYLRAQLKERGGLMEEICGVG